MRGDRFAYRRLATARACVGALLWLPVVATPAAAQDVPPGLDLPRAGNDPREIDGASDPVIGIVRASADPDAFRAMIARAVAEAPTADEALAEVAAARAGRGEARAGLFPTVDLAGTSYRSIARSFSNRIETIVEQSRAQTRTDLTASAQQTIVDFGATEARIEAANARLLAAAANVDEASDRVALQAIAAWYDVFMYRALVRLGEAFTTSQGELRDAVERRVMEGVSALGDTAQVGSYSASADARLAGYRRRLSDAEVRFQQLLRVPPPLGLQRAPLLAELSGDQAAAGAAALDRPAVRVVDAQAEAARQDARVARAETWPNLSATVQAGRYGVLEDFRDYDVRGVVTIRKRFFGGVDARADRIRAQAGVAEARAMAAREEAVRDAEIAWADVRALETQLAATERSYLAARQSRDVLVERFRVARGSLIDVIAAEDSFFQTAASYIQTVGELDAARYVLLSRTGRLADALNIPAAEGRVR